MAYFSVCDGGGGTSPCSPPIIHFLRKGPLGSHGCQTLNASFRQSAPCNRNNCKVGNPRTWSVIFNRWFLICYWCFSYSIQTIANSETSNRCEYFKWYDLSAMSCRALLRYRDICSLVPQIWHVVGGGVDDEWLFAFTARKETLSERIGNIALDCPIVRSFGKTLGCNPPSCGRVQPLTSSILIDW